MSGLRDYTAGTRAALVTLSRGACYFPGCGEPVVRLTEDDYYVNYEIAHIRGAKEKGARHDPKMSEAQRKAFPNLILLCLVHHKRVDRTHQEKYKPETLLKWKTDREADGEGALAGLTRLTEDDLESILVEAFQARQDQIIKILERLEQHDKEAAGLLKEMIRELELFREYSALFDPDSANRLYHASLYLADLNLGRTAANLTTAASGLEPLSNTADILMRTTKSLTALIARLEGMEGRW